MGKKQSGKAVSAKDLVARKDTPKNRKKLAAAAKTELKQIKAAPVLKKKKTAAVAVNNRDSDDEQGEQMDEEESDFSDLESSDDEDIEDDDMQVENSAEDISKSLEAIAAKTKEKLKKRQVNPADEDTSDRGVVYLGHIPYGFFEDQMRGFFAQFGQITRLRLARNKKTVCSFLPFSFGFLACKACLFPLPFILSISRFLICTFSRVSLLFSILFRVNRSITPSSNSPTRT